jgi:hypothetical protein
MSDYFDNSGNDDEDTFPEITLDDILFGNSPDNDALELMWNAVEAGKDSTAWSDFGDYIWDWYSIDINSEWEWADFKEWYDAQ